MLAGAKKRGVLLNLFETLLHALFVANVCLGGKALRTLSSYFLRRRSYNSAYTHTHTHVHINSQVFFAKLIIEIITSFCAFHLNHHQHQLLYFPLADHILMLYLFIFFCLFSFPFSLSSLTFLYRERHISFRYNEALLPFAPI